MVGRVLDPQNLLGDWDWVIGICTPIAIERWSHDHGPCRNCSSGHQVNHIMISEIDGREDKAADDGKKNIKENPFIPVGQVQDSEGNLGMAAGHAVPSIMFNRIQSVPNPVGDKTALKGHGVKGCHCIPGAHGGKENITDERDIITKGQNEERRIKTRPIPEKKNKDQGQGKKIVTDISKGEEIRKPGSDPMLHPDRGFHTKQELIDPNQGRVDIGMEVMNQIAKGFIDQNDKKDGGEDMDQSPKSFLPL